MTSRRVLRGGAVRALALSVLAASGCNNNQATEDERAVVGVVERFLGAAGRFDLDSLPHFFAPNANIGATSPRDGVALPIGSR